MTNIELMVLIKHGVKLDNSNTGAAYDLVERGLCEYHSDLHFPENRAWKLTLVGNQFLDSLLEWIESQPYDGQEDY